MKYTSFYFTMKIYNLEVPQKYIMRARWNNATAWNIKCSISITITIYVQKKQFFESNKIV